MSAWRASGPFGRGGAAECRHGLFQRFRGGGEELAHDRLLLHPLEEWLLAVHARGLVLLDPLDGDAAAAAVGAVGAAVAAGLRGGANHVLVALGVETALDVPDAPAGLAQEAGALVDR